MNKPTNPSRAARPEPAKAKMQDLLPETFVEAGWTFHYLVGRMTGASKLIVLMPSAQTLRRRRVPYFNRWAWHEDFDCNVIAVSDPTQQLHPSMIGGWFQGLHVDYVLPRVLNHIGQYLKEFGLGWADCCFVGSSLGGFASLQAICHYPDARAFVEIPQIDLRAYSDPSMPLLAKASYGELSIDAISAQYLPRLSVIETLKETGAIGRFHCVQRVADGHHLREHYTPFANHITLNAGKVLPNGARFELLVSEQEGPAHQALPREEAVSRIHTLINQ